jgi:hypothetical protein
LHPSVAHFSFPRVVNQNVAHEYSYEGTQNDIAEAVGIFKTKDAQKNVSSGLQQ